MRKYLAVLAVSAVALSGCAGSDSGGESDVSGPIKLFQIGPVQSQAVSLPGLQYSAEAEVAEINEAGGVNGRKLELTTCNDKYDPNESLRCAQRAVREGAVAMVGTLTTYENSLNPVFEKAGLANVAPDAITAAGAKSDTTFLLDAGVPGYAAFPIVAKEKLGAAKIAAVHFENPSIDSTQKFFEDGAELAGIDVVAKIVIPADAIDFAQYVAQAERAGAEAFVSAMGPDTNLKLWKALEASGSDLKVVTPAGSVSEMIVKQAGAAAEGSYSVASIPAATAENPTGAAYLETLKKFGDPKASPDGVGLRAWASVKLFAEVAGTIDGDIDRSSVLNAFSKVHDMKFLWVDSLSFDEEGPITGLPRVVSALTFPQLIRDGAFVADDPVDPFASTR